MLFRSKMQIVLNIIFSLELALLFVHEMDAVRRQEWKMFVKLKDMEDEKAYRVFMLLHIPLYTAILALLLSGYYRIGFYITGVFLIAHTLVHTGFRKHTANKLTSGISKSIIFISGILAAVHLLLICFLQ